MNASGRDAKIDRSIDRFENVFVENPVLVIIYLWLFMWLLFILVPLFLLLGLYINFSKL